MEAQAVAQAVRTLAEAKPTAAAVMETCWTRAESYDYAKYVVNLLGKKRRWLEQANAYIDIV